MGNPLTYRGYTFGWRGKQLTSASNGTNSLTFEYNEDGLRQKKTVNNVDTDYFYNGSVLIGMQRGTDKLLFSYDAGGSAVSVDFNGTEYYYLRNAQGDIVKLIDASGASVVEYTYDTWGKKVQITGSLASSLGLIQPFRYRGYVYDEETGLYYLQSRYYDPTTDRFISADVMLSTGQGVLGHNAYAYCLDDPANMFDDGGERSRRLTGRTEKEDGSGGVVNGGGSINDSSAPCGNGVPYQPDNTSSRASTSSSTSHSSFSNSIFEKWLNKGPKNNTVYFGKSGGKYNYTGITMQPLDQRLKQHRATGKDFDYLDAKHPNLTRNQARAIEQYYIETGPNALNRINSISPRSMFYSYAMQWASNQVK